MLRDCFYYIRYARRIKRLKKENQVSEMTGYGSYEKRWRAAIVVAAILWIVSAAGVFADLRGADDESIISAFAGNSYSEAESSVYIYGKYSDAYVSEAAKEIILAKIAQDIGVRDCEAADIDTGDGSQKVLSKISKNGDVIVKFITMPQDDEGKYGQYIYIGITLKDNIDSAFTYEKKVKEIAQRLNIDGNVYVSLAGRINERLDASQCAQYTQDMLDRMGAVYVTGKSSDDIYTVYAYTSDIDDYISIGKQKVNINITVSYDEAADKTDIILATPIYNSDY